MKQFLLKPEKVAINSRKTIEQPVTRNKFTQVLCELQANFMQSHHRFVERLGRRFFNKK